MWMERAVDGTAAGAHLRGTITRLRLIHGVSVERLIADTTTPDGQEPYLRKGKRLLRLILTGLLAARRGRVLVARYHPLILPVVLVWKLVGAKVILSVQGSLDEVSDNEYPWLGESRLFRVFSVASTRIADGVIAGAPVLYQHIRDNMIGRRTVLVSMANGVFLEEFRAACKMPRPMEGKYAVFVGNLASWQGIETMARATTEPSWPPAFPLVVVGDGTERDHLANHSGIVWLGRLPSAEAARWLAHAYCALALKRSDSAVGTHGYWPFKLIESAAAGVPIISSNAKGMEQGARELGHSVIVQAQNPSAAAAAVRRLYDDKELRDRLAKRGLKNVERFAWEAGAPVLAELLNAVYGRTGQSCQT